MTEGLMARLVWDGVGEVMIPPEMGVSAPDQMQGTPRERVSELACRVCYSSLGTREDGKPKGRSSAELHKHILEVKHTSVFEHPHFTIRIEPNNVLGAIAAAAGRPGVWVEPDSERGYVRITANLTTVAQWEEWSERLPCSSKAGFFCSGDAREVGGALAELGHQLAPQIVPAPERKYQYEHVAPIGPYERWITLFLRGSRGFSHELVRHGDFTAISQRSTRFVDESSSDWITHPLLAAWLHGQEIGGGNLNVRPQIDHAVKTCRDLYDTLVPKLEDALVAGGAGKLAARKQARGAARGYLGNALSTELIFSAAVGQWKHILRQRASAAADAEIREVICMALGELKRSAYGADFEAFKLQPSPDGIGQIAVET